MSAKPSTTIGFERAFNPVIGLVDLDAFVAESASISSPEAAEPDADRRAQPGPVPGSAARGRGARRRARRLSAARRAPGRRASRRPSARVAQRARLGVELHHEGRVHPRRRSRHHRGRNGRRRGDASGRRTALGRIPRDRRVPAERRRRADGARHRRRARVAAHGGGRGARRAREGRARHGLHPRQPKRALPAARDVLPRPPADRPVVTICESGARAAIAASILRGRGYDARPVVDGGIIDWRARGGDNGRVPALRQPFCPQIQDPRAGSLDRYDPEAGQPYGSNFRITRSVQQANA